MDTQMYDILELVGQGSYGHVYKGRINDTGRIVALKFLPKVNRSEKELQNLKQEIDILRRLLHPHIVQLYDSFETETQVVIVTEYAEGQLFKVLQNGGKLRESQIREIACQLVSALYYLHSNRILHRDMKPQNILLGKNGVVKLCDFGYARVMSNSTFVLTSLKGTPLYMSPELLQEKPYDHTADLWSLGCILYELYTGLPPFYTDSMITLVKLLTKCNVKWPDSMSDAFQSLLKGLLTKDPEMRLSWPDLLYHPFVSGSVLVLSDTNVFSPLTVAPTPDMKALKREQATAKMAQMRARKRYRPPEPVRCRSQISIDYEREFPAAEVGPQLVRKTVKNKQTKPLQQNADSEQYWKLLAKESDPGKEQDGPLNYTAVISQLKAKIPDVLKHQLRGGTVEEAWQIHYPLKVLRNLLQTTELSVSHHLGRELGLPHVLFDLVQDTVENSISIKRPWRVSALEEIIVVLMIYWDKYPDWIEEEHRLEEFIEPFVQILRQSDLIPLAPLAASVLSLFKQHDVDVKVDMNNITSLLRNLLLDSFEPTLSLPSGWGICDGPLLLLLETLLKDENQSGASHLDPVVFLDLWEKNSTLLSKTTAGREFCSAAGLFYFLSTALFVFSVDPDLCISLFSKRESKCVHTLGRLLSSDCLHLFSEDASGGHEVDLTHDNLSILSCQLLCFPFAMDLPTDTMATILHLYDSCGIVTSLLQLIQTLPAQSLELPLSLLSRLLLCDPEHSVPCIGNDVSGLFTSPGSNQLTDSMQQSMLTRTASSLLRDLVQVEVNWDAAAELLTLLSLVARFPTQPSCLQLHLDASVLHEALAHSYDQIRIATCRLLGNLDPFRPPTLQPDIFKTLIGCLHDPHLSVRRMACRAVGNWLGYIAAGAGFKVGRSTPKHGDTRGSGKQREQHRRRGSHNETAGEEGGRWIHEAHRTAAILPPLITDRDALTRCHSCAALRNLVNVEGAVPLLVEKDVANLLVRAACTDSHKAVRQAAIATLCLYSEHESIRQVLISLDARKKLVQASRRAPPQCDYHQLIGKLQLSPADEE